VAEQTIEPTPTSSIRATATEAPFLAVIDKQRKFQAQWRRLMMSLYVGTTVGTILATASATLVAALDYAKSAAVLAGLGTVLVSLEKSLLFRERWRLHIRIETLLEGVDVDYRTGRISLEQATARYQSVMDDYAEQVPVRSREEE
jgi:multidrug transporter EmrE-like cation transporter